MDQPEITCPNCGAPNPVGAVLCERCGSALPQPAATLRLDPSEVLPGGGPGKATLRVEPDEVPGFEPATPGQQMGTMRVEPEEIPPPSPPAGMGPAYTPAADFAPPPPPPAAQPPKKSNRNVIIGVVVGVFACLCLCCCALTLIAYNFFSTGGFNF